MITTGPVHLAGGTFRTSPEQHYPTGGSFVCADDHRQRYRPAARRPQTVDTGISHLGFRTVVREAADDG